MTIIGNIIKGALYWAFWLTVFAILMGIMNL